MGLPHCRMRRICRSVGRGRIAEPSYHSYKGCFQRGAFMLSILASETELGAENPVPLHAVLPKDLERLLSSLGDAQARWLRATGFAGKEGELVLVPNETGGLGAAVLGLGAGRDPHALALFSERLPPGLYRLADVPPAFAGAGAAYAWGIGAYAFERYRSQAK